MKIWFFVVVSLSNWLMNLCFNKENCKNLTVSKKENWKNLTVSKKEKRLYLPHCYSDKDLKCIVGNQTCHSKNGG